MLCRVHNIAARPSSGGAIVLAEQSEGVLGAARVDPPLGADDAQAVEHRVAMDAERTGGGSDAAVGAGHRQQGVRERLG